VCEWIGGSCVLEEESGDAGIIHIVVMHHGMVHHLWWLLMLIHRHDHIFLDIIHIRSLILLLLLLLMLLHSRHAIFAIFIFLFHPNSCDHLEFTADDHTKAFPTDGFFHTGNSRAITPFVEFTAESVCFVLEESKFAGCEGAMAPGCVDVGDGRVDDGGFGGAPDLGEIGEKLGEVEESAVESFTALSFDCVVSCTTLCGVGPSAGLALHLSVGGCCWCGCWSWS